MRRQLGSGGGVVRDLPDGASSPESADSAASTRRTVLAGLLGTIGLAALTACTKGEADGGASAEALVNGTTIRWADSVAQLRLLVGGAASGSLGVVIVQGYSTPGDGGGGVFVWGDTTTNVEDGGTVIVQTSGAVTVGVTTGKAWLRVYDGAFNVKWFGARGDGTTPDDTAFLNAINAMKFLAPVTAGGTKLVVPAGKYRLSNMLHIDRAMVLEGMSGAYARAGTILLFDAGRGLQVDPISGTGARGDVTVIRNLMLQSAGKVPAAHGITMNTTAVIENCYINNFGGDGVHIVGDLNANPQTSASSFQLTKLTIEGNGGHGLYVSGGDASAGLALNVFVVANGGWGIWDDSFLGNTYVGCYAEVNTLGPFRTTKTTACNTFVGCMTEVAHGSPPCNLVAPTYVFGGDYASPDPVAGAPAFALVPTDGSGVQVPQAIIHTAGYTSPSKVTTVQTGLPTITTLLGSDVNGILSAFGFDSSAETPGNAWRLTYNFNGTGWWGLNQGNAASLCPIGISGTQAAEGPGQLRLTNGFYLGWGGTQRKVTNGSSPPVAGTAGDIVYNINPTPGGSIGWVCTTSGNPATWKTFGVISA